MEQYSLLLFELHMNVLCHLLLSDKNDDGHFNLVVVVADNDDDDDDEEDDDDDGDVGDVGDDNNVVVDVVDDKLLDNKDDVELPNIENFELVCWLFLLLLLLLLLEVVDD